ncbi:MAG: polysaccharide lyase 6 family protein [Halioglobus sp.]
MISRHFFFSLFLLLFSYGPLASGTVYAEEFLVKTQGEFQKAVARAEPGSTIVLKNGVWKDFEILFEGKGNAEQPITLTAETKGEVVISGQSNLRIAGEHLVVSGLVFRDGYTPTNSVIAFRKSKGELANYSRVTETVIDSFNNPERFEMDHWVAMYGKHNRYDHNHLEGKGNKGVTMAVILNSEASQENYHRIDHNYFGPRSVLGSNGGETLRIGTSAYSLTNSFTLVENNYFDRSNGEVEIVSVKSGRNHLRGNVFYESQGGLALRHGNDNLIEENIFFGNGVAHTGGIRVINKRQTIRNNYLEGLTGYRFGGGLVVMNGVPNSPINRYHQVEEALIEKNTLINVDHVQLAAGSDEERSAVPVKSEFSDNLIFNEDKHDVFTLFDDMSGISFENNVLYEVKSPQLTQGFSSQKFKMVRGSNGLLAPESGELDGVGAKRDMAVLDKKQTGAQWYPKTDSSIQFGVGGTIDVKPNGPALQDVIAKAEAGDIIRLAAGDYGVSKVLKIDKPLTLNGNGDVRIDFERSALFEIVDGGSLQLKGLSISGEKAPDNVGNSVLRTSRYSMLVNYKVSIENCEFSDLDVNKSFTVFQSAKSTMADSINIVDSSFRDVTGSILKLDSESDDYGIFNADYVRIKNSSFTNIQGAVVDLYRGGTDESTFGPHFSLTGSKLQAVGTGSKNKSGASVNLHGVQVASIKDNEFLDSAPIKLFHTVGDPVSEVTGNTFVATSAPEVIELHSKKENTATISDNIVRKK